VNWEIKTLCVQALVGGSTLKHFKMNDIIVREGQPVEGLYQISRGSVRIEKRGATQHLAKLERYSVTPNMLFSCSWCNRGELFGEVMFLQRGNAPANIVANDEHVDVYFLKHRYVVPTAAINQLLSRAFFFCHLLFLCLALLCPNPPNCEVDSLIFWLVCLQER
jgi:hypothetical protein